MKAGFVRNSGSPDDYDIVTTELLLVQAKAVPD